MTGLVVRPGDTLFLMAADTGHPTTGRHLMKRNALYGFVIGVLLLFLVVTFAGGPLLERIFP